MYFSLRNKMALNPIFIYLHILVPDLPPREHKTAIRQQAPTGGAEQDGHHHSGAAAAAAAGAAAGLTGGLR